MSAVAPWGVIDLHTHVVPFDIPARVRSVAKWPTVEPGSDCRHRSIFIDGKLFRSVEDGAWNSDRRSEAMHAAGIACQILSPMPELLSYWLPADICLDLCRYLNANMAEMVSRAPDRFAALGAVPLQDPHLAARELEELMRDGRFRGVEIGSNIDGIPIGDARFAPFFAAAEALGAAVFVHALHPTGIERLVGPPGLEQLAAFPGETALAAISLITAGVIQRHPRLRIAFSHGGGGLALTLPRLEHGWPLLQLGDVGPTEQARTLYFDTLVYDGTVLRFLMEVFGDRQLCLGTDYPFAIQDRQPVPRIQALGLDPVREQRLLRNNALRFLGMEKSFQEEKLKV